MRTADADFIADFNARAVAAQREEIDFRQNIAAEITKRERRRQFAFRRLDLAKTMAAAAHGAKDQADAVSQQLAALKRELDWHSDSEARTRVLDAWRPVAEAIWLGIAPEEGSEQPRQAAAPDAVALALAEFETWYEAKHGSPFLALLDVEIQELPLVEF